MNAQKKVRLTHDKTGKQEPGKMKFRLVYDGSGQPQSEKWLADSKARLLELRNRGIDLRNRADKAQTAYSFNQYPDTDLKRLAQDLIAHQRAVIDEYNRFKREYSPEELVEKWASVGGEDYGLNLEWMKNREINPGFAGKIWAEFGKAKQPVYSNSGRFGVPDVQGNHP